MTDADALEILRAQGHLVSSIDPLTGRVRIWIYGSEEAIEVQAGNELRDLAAGKLTLEEARELCQPEERVGI